jgi:hypothetical protein
MRSSLSSLFKGRLQMLGEDEEPFSEGSMGTDLHPYPDGSSDALMDVSRSNTYYMSAPASGPMEYGKFCCFESMMGKISDSLIFQIDLAKIQQFV